MHSSVVCQCSSCNTGEICSCFGVSATILACVLNRLKFLDIVCFGGPHGSELRVRMVGSELNHTRRKRGKKEKKKTRGEWSSLRFFSLDKFLTALSEPVKQAGDQGAPPVKTFLFVWSLAGSFP